MSFDTAEARRNMSKRNGLPLQHEQYMRMSTDVRVDRDREAKVVVFAIEIVEVVPPELLYGLGVYPTVRIWRFFDKHHWGQVVEVPIGWDLTESCRRTWCERFHPVCWQWSALDVVLSML